MSTTLSSQHIVAIGEQCEPVGILEYGAIRNKQVSSFRYLAQWLQDPQAFAISPSLPLDEQSSYFSSQVDNLSASLPGVLSDCAPDSWGRSILERSSGRALNELEYLLRVDDTTRQGALRLLDDSGAALASDVPPVPRLTDLEYLQRLCATLEAGTGDLQEVAQELRGASASLGGARPKSVVLDAHGDLHVAKFTMQGDARPIERAEVATLALARDVGIRAARATLVMAKSSSPIALIKRFDRGSGGKGRIHYMSAQTLLNSSRGTPRFYTDIADALRSVCLTGEMALAELKELHRRILFTILVSNNDDHLKNHGLLYVGQGNWALSPAFDINPQPQRHPQLKTGISELSGFDPSVKAWVDAAPFFEVSEDDAREEAVSMASRISGRWRKRFVESGITQAQCKEYAAAFDHAQMKTALRMGDRLTSA